MPIFKLPIGLVVALCLTMSACSQFRNDAAQAPAADPADGLLQYSGRIDFSKPDQPVFIWQGSSVSGRFEGERLALEFDDVAGEAWFELRIDDRPQVLDARARHFELSAPSGSAAHSFTLTKRSEADAGHARLAAVNARLVPPAAPPKPAALRLLFLGDSITAGACNEDGAEDQWETRATHNALLSYAALTADALQAEYRNISVSGMGISTGYVPITALETWNRLYPRSDVPASLDDGWQPDLVFINLGENDDSFTRKQALPFPSDYTERYVQLVRDMRRHYPLAQFVILRGGMFGGAQSERLRAPWQEVVTTLQKEDEKVSSFAFAHWTPHHPRVTDHQAMAAELTAWLRSQHVR